MAVPKTEYNSTLATLSDIFSSSLKANTTLTEKKIQGHNQIET